MRKYKKDLGITLIALVITIIILLILAGVTIVALSGDNGILTQAQNSREKTEKANIIEQVKLDILEKQIEKNIATIYKEDLKEILDKHFETVPDDFTLDTLLQAKEEYGDYQILVSEIYNGELIEGSKKAGDVLKVNPDGEEAKDKSPYIQYNGILCRVLYNDEAHGLQIISADNITEDEKMLEITLGSGDTTITGVNGDFNIARASYNNAVDTLNNKAKEYMDGNTIDARSLGWIAILEGGKFQEDTTEMFTGTESYLESYGWNGNFKVADTNYEEDVNQIKALELNGKKYTWLASRYIDSNSRNTDFYVRYMDTYGNERDYPYQLCNVGAHGSHGCASRVYGFRPVFLLSYDLVIGNGDGSEENPYVIE